MKKAAPERSIQRLPRGTTELRVHFEIDYHAFQTRQRDSRNTTILEMSRRWDGLRKNLGARGLALDGLECDMSSASRVRENETTDASKNGAIDHRP